MTSGQFFCLKFLILITSILPLAIADDQVIDRTNWGVIFRQKAQLYNGENTWKHTFQIKLDFLASLQFKSQALRNLCLSNSSTPETLFCRDLHRTVKIVSKMRHSTLKKLNTTLMEKAGSCLPLVGSLQYRTLANYMYWFPLPFQLPVVI